MKVTKKIILFLFIGSLACGSLFYSCQSEDTYIPQEQLLKMEDNHLRPNKSQIHTLEKFDEVIDEKLSFKDGQFFLDIKSGSEIGLDQELFDYYQERLKTTNEYLSQMIEEGFLPVEVKRNVIQFVNTKNKIGLNSVIINPEYPYTIPSGGLKGVSLTGMFTIDVYVKANDVYMMYNSFEPSIDSYSPSKIALLLPFQAPSNVANDLAIHFNSLYESPLPKDNLRVSNWLNTFSNGMHIREHHMHSTFEHQQVGTVVWLLEGSTN